MTTKDKAEILTLARTNYKIGAVIRPLNIEGIQQRQENEHFQMTTVFESPFEFFKYNHKDHTGFSLDTSDKVNPIKDGVRVSTTCAEENDTWSVIYADGEWAQILSDGHTTIEDFRHEDEEDNESPLAGLFKELKGLIGGRISDSNPPLKSTRENDLMKPFEGKDWKPWNFHNTEVRNESQIFLKNKEVAMHYCEQFKAFLILYQWITDHKYFIKKTKPSFFSRFLPSHKSALPGLFPELTKEGYAQLKEDLGDTIQPLFKR